MRSIFALAAIVAVVYGSEATDEEEFMEFIAMEAEFDSMNAGEDQADLDEMDAGDADSGAIESMYGKDMVEFAMFASINGKNYKDYREFQGRKAIWQKNHDKVQKLNQSSHGAKFTDKNPSADLTKDEIRRMLGLTSESADESRRVLLDTNSHRNLQDEDYTIDWVAQDRVSAVKNQGYCGSCWSFTGTLALESMQAIKDDTTPIRLSEQQGVDCTTNTAANKELFGETYNTWGCEGGWMNRYWNFARDQGAMKFDDYQYTGEADQPCEHDAEKIVSRAGEAGQITTNLTDAKKQLQDGPLTIAVAAGNDCWLNYESGILDSTNRCPKWIDHAVVIVGLGTETVTKTVTTRDKYKWSCARVTSTEKAAKQCDSDTALLYKRKYCCEKELVSEGTTTTEEVEQEYWLIQNSWDTTWGESGFIRLAVEGGYGVSGMNQVIEWVTVQDV